ncbi:MAG: hypothetical protein HOP13_15900 [Alphaproteobacteria bacterium]|nr:hypothetical protein [Alphaproteobacteria bacterium]
MFMRPVALAGILASTTILAGCAGTVAGVSLSSISSFAGFASTIFTGADLGEHAVSLVTGKDCRFSEGLVREDRDICEEPGSAATRGDFHGIFVERIEADGTVVYAAPRYMPVNMGAGEGEATTDTIWAEIKTAKAKEETERQLARANAQQQIDVAALATTTVSSDSLAFMPTNSSDMMDGDTASQTASNPRSVVNASAPKPAKDTKAAPAVDTDQPALDATTFAAASLEATGAGGPFIATATSGTPVTSKLINGEPVVVLRLRPSMSASSAAPVETAAATPSDMPEFTETAVPLQPTKVALRPTATPRSPQMIITDVPVRPTFPATPTRVAQVDPLAGAATKPKTKPVVEKLAEKPVTDKVSTEKKPVTTALAETKPATGAPRKPPAATDAYEPPEDAAFVGSVPVQTPADVPATPDASGTAFSQPDAAPVAPSPLIPMQQE